MKINTEKFKAFLEHNINITKRNRDDAVKHGNYEAALSYDNELTGYEYLLNAWEEPEEYEWMEKE